MRRKLQLLDFMLYSTAVLLLAGAGEITSLFDWLLAVPLPGDWSLAQYSNLSRGIGLICSLVAVSLFLPPVAQLQSEARSFAEQSIRGRSRKPVSQTLIDTWMKENGIHFSSRYQGVRLVAAASPMLSAFFGVL